MALMSAQDFLKSKGSLSSSSPAPKGLMSAKDFMIQKEKPTTDAFMQDEKNFGAPNMNPSFPVAQKPVQPTSTVPVQPVQEQKSTPLLAKIQSEIYDHTLKPAENFLQRAASSAVNALTFNQANKFAANNQTSDPSFVQPIVQQALKPANGFADKAADTLGGFYGMAAIPGLGIGGNIAEKGLAKLAPNAPSFVASIARGLGMGATYGALNQGVDAATGGQSSILDRAKNIGENALMFGGAEAGLPLVGKLAKYTGTKIGDALSGFFKKTEAQPTTQPNETLALPPASDASMARYNKLNGNVQPPNTEPILGHGDIYNPEPLALNESPQYNAIQRIKAQQTLGLPEASPQTISDFNRRNGNVLPTNTTPIIGKGNIAEPLGLPQGNYTPPTVLRPMNAQDSFTYAMDKVIPKATEKMTPPLENPNELAKWVQGHLNDAGHNVSLNEVRKLSYEDLRQFSQMMIPKLKVSDVVRNTAHEMGYGKIYDETSPTIKDRMAADAQSRVYGVPAPKVNIQRPNSFNVQHEGTAASPKQGLSFKREPRLSDAKVNKETPQQMQQRYERQIKEANDRKQIADLSKPIIGRAAMPETKISFSSDIKAETPIKDKALNTSAQPKLIDLKSVKAPNASKYTKEREQIMQERQANPQNIHDVIQTKEPRIRDKVVNFFDNAEQAARDRLAAKKNTLSSLPLDQYADHAIIGAAKIVKGTVKFADWSEKMIKDFGEEIKPHLRSIYNKSLEHVREAERRETKQAQEAKVFNEKQTGDANSFRGKISRDIKAAKIPFSKKWERVRAQTVDDMAPLEGLEKNVRGKVSSAENSLYKAARMFKGVPEKANHIVKDELAPIINGIEKSGYTTEDLGDYALAVHAKDVNARDIKSGFTNKEIDNVIQKLGSPEMEAARKKLVKLSEKMLNELADNGVISHDLVDSLKERYPNYMPLFRAFDDEKVNFSDGLSKSLANVTSPIKGLIGSEQKVSDPFENMVKNIFQSTNAIERNKVSLQLSKLAKDDKDSQFIRKLEPGEEVGRKNVVSVLQDGKKVQYEVEPDVYKALLNMNKESSNVLIKILQKPAAILRAGATLTPDFSIRNPMRDVVQAFITSDSGFNPLIDFPVGLIQSISKGNLYKQWVHELGAYGNVISSSREVHKEALERVLKEPASKKFVNVVNGKTLMKVLRSISDTTESATKVGEFRAALRQGQTPQEAAYRSRDLMDFARSGSSIRETNKIVAFLNANIQGKSKLIRAFKANPAGFTARAFTAITAPTIGEFLMQKYTSNDAQKATIDDAPDWMKDTFWLIPVPGSDQVARIPKPFDLNILFSNLPKRAMDYIFNNDKQSMDQFAQRSMTESALPSMISGLVPIIEGMSNYSFFREGRIIPQGEDTRNFSDQFDINTTETAKLLAKGAEKITGGQGSFKNFSSPRIMDNTIQGVTAGLGGYATSAVDVLLDKFNFTHNPAKPAKDLAQKPLLKSFLVNPTQSGKSMDKLYSLKDKLTREEGSAKLNNKPFPDNSELTAVNNQTQYLGTITKSIHAIEKDMTLTSTQKRDKIDDLLNRRNEVARQAIKNYKP